jgi:SAM-dependent methyltransferase
MRRLLERLLSPVPPERRRRLRRPAMLGTLRRTHPLGEHWGWDRGRPIDRYYIEQFLAGHAGDIRGRVLEVKDDSYTRTFGTGVEKTDVLDIDGANERATIVADLARADAVPDATFDCVVLTQTLQYVYDVGAAVANVHRMLRDRGVALVTVPSLSRVVLDEDWGDYWRFTSDSCEALFAGVFGPEAVTVVSYGNVLAAVGFLSGLAIEDLRTRELKAADARFPVIIGVRAQRMTDR